MNEFLSAVSTLHGEGRFDSVRYDAPKCRPGNKPCGSTCIPQEYRCKRAGGTVKSSKKKGRWGLGQKVGATVLGAAGVTGLIGAGKSIIDRHSQKNAPPETDWDNLVDQSEETLKRAKKMNNKG